MDTYISTSSPSGEVADVFMQTAISTDRVSKSLLADHGPVLAVGARLALKELMPEVKRKAAA